MQDKPTYICTDCIKDKYIKKYIINNKNKIHLVKCQLCDSENCDALSISLLAKHVRICIAKLYAVKNKNEDTDRYLSCDRTIYDSDLETYLEDVSNGLKEATGTSDIFLSKILKKQVFSQSFMDKNLLSLHKFANHMGYPYGDATLERNDCYNRDDSTIKLSWSNFINIVKYNNRFFSQKQSQRDDMLKKLDPFLHSCKEEIATGSQFSRIRIVDMKNYSEREIQEDGFLGRNRIKQREASPAPAKYLKNNRLSPCGISYTYLTDDTNTGLSECRVQNGQNVLIASFSAKKNISVVNFSKSQSTWTNIFWDNYNIKNQSEQDFITEFINEISKPINTADREIEYIPTQVLAEYIRYLGYDGIAYNSSVDVGINYVLFCGPDTEKFPEHKSENIESNLPPYTDFLEFIEAKWHVVSVKKIYSLDSRQINI